MSTHPFTCSFCGHQFTDAERVETCSRCSMFGTGGCKKIRCPHCKYEMTPPPRLPGLVARMVKKLAGKR